MANKNTPTPTTAVVRWDTEEGQKLALRTIESARDNADRVEEGMKLFSKAVIAAAKHARDVAYYNLDDKRAVEGGWQRPRPPAPFSAPRLDKIHALFEGVDPDFLLEVGRHAGLPAEVTDMLSGASL